MEIMKNMDKVIEFGDELSVGCLWDMVLVKLSKMDIFVMKCYVDFLIKNKGL